MAAAIAIQTRISISILDDKQCKTGNRHQPEPSLRIGFNYEFGRGQGCTIVGAGQCGAVVNTLKGNTTEHFGTAKSVIRT
jgi:hypothetical protein